MNKTYEYKTKFFNYKIRDIGIFAILFLFYSIYNLVSTKNSFFSVPIIICIYIIWEDFISLSNPKTVTITDDSITFGAFGKFHTYKWSEIKKFQIKEFISSRKMYIRINEAGLFKGRYWVNCYFMNDCDEIYMYLRDKEYELNPNSLKSIARRTNEADFEERKKKAEEKKKQKEKEKEEKKNNKKIRKLSKSSNGVNDSNIEQK